MPSLLLGCPVQEHWTSWQKAVRKIGKKDYKGRQEGRDSDCFSELEGIILREHQLARDGPERQQSARIWLRG